MDPARSFQLSREEAARREIGRTDISRRTAGALAGVFLLAIAGVPVVQWIVDRRGGTEGPAGRSPMVETLADLSAPWRAAEGASVPRRIAAVNAAILRAIDETDTAAAASSWIGRLAMPWAQAVLTRGSAVGNEKAYVGRDGWLFFRDDVDHLTGPGFLAPRQLRRRAAGGNEWRAPPQPDPVRAIESFHRELAARGIALIVMPTPVKPAIHPDRFRRDYEGMQRPLRNPSYEAFRLRLDAAGVRVFDPSDLLSGAARRSGLPQYLATDTHWRPEAMERAAGALADLIRSLPGWSSGGSGAGFRRAEESVANRGDIAGMLTLPERFMPEPETVTIRPVLTARQELWRSAPDAPVLLLGDSFSNIYSLPAMGWGGGAGLAEQMSFALDAPVDRLVRNDAGAWATRQMLARDLALGRDRLAGKRVVVWQFAMRELSQGDWREIPLVAGTPAARRMIALAPGESRVVTGTVVSVSAVPRPGSVPYRDHILSVHLGDVDAPPDPVNESTEALVYMSSMKTNALQPAAFLRGGQSVRVRISAWADVADALESVNRSEPDDPVLQLEEPVWGELIHE